MTLVTRPDLSARTELSKSQLVATEMCQTAAWFDIHDRRPLIPSEKLTFGSAVDAGVEQIVYAAARGIAAGSKARQAAMEVAERDGMELPWDEVDAALAGFVDAVLPAFDWTDAVVQPTVRADIAGLGPCSGHPDIILADGSVLDVKTAGKPKDPNSVELGFYAVLVEATGLAVPRVGYLAWIRLKRPYWQVAVVDTTDELRRYAMARAMAFARARDLDAHVNDGETSPVNYTLTGGPSRDWKCPTCQYAPANGGPCEIAAREATE
jgi:hypothetical protein